MSSRKPSGCPPEAQAVVTAWRTDGVEIIANDQGVREGTVPRSYRDLGYGLELSNDLTPGNGLNPVLPSVSFP